jgi:CRISPR-associated protein Cmr1
MTELEYQLTFTTPAFLGNAEQNGQWRTPPIKALLRQWWRVAYAANHGFAVRVDDMRRDEALLFGHAWLENDTFQRDGKPVTTAARKSEIRMRLSSWAAGKLTSWNGLEQGTVHHPETEKTGYKVGPHAYLGFGPLDGRGGTKLSKGNAAIQAGESATLSLAVPNDHAAHIEQALTLMHHYGTLGGRSRNGWGSFSLTPLGNTPSLGGEVPLRPLDEALRLDWPHAIGQDERGPLIWQTAPCADWKAMMKQLAIIKIGLRTKFGFTTGKNAPHPEDRHWLSYPVTNHSVHPWGNNARLPNSLRFKVRAAPGGQLVGVIFHVPCAPPPAFGPNSTTLAGIWKKVHAFLDAPAQSLTRIPE